jgi:hypothetical protein
MIVIWLVGVVAATSWHAMKLVRMWLIGRHSTENLDHLKNIKMNLNAWTWKTRMTQNVPELQEVNRSEVVVGEVGTTTHQILVAALFVIHVVMQWISFESIAKCSIVNEISQLIWSIVCYWAKAWEWYSSCCLSASSRCLRASFNISISSRSSERRGTKLLTELCDDWAPFWAPTF